MTIKGLTLLLLLAFAFNNCSVSGVRDCTLPWNRPKSIKDVYNLGLIGVADYGISNVCPSVIGDQKKEYCCFTISGDVSCCDQQGAIVFGVIVLIVFIIIIWMSCCCICRVCCPRSSRGQNGIVLMPVPIMSNGSNQTPVSTDLLHLVPNEHLSHNTHW